MILLIVTQYPYLVEKKKLLHCVVKLEIICDYERFQKGMMLQLFFFHLGKSSGLIGTAGLCIRLGTSVFITLRKTAAFYSILMPLATKCH